MTAAKPRRRNHVSQDESRTDEARMDASPMHESHDAEPRVDEAPVDWYFDFISPFAYIQHELLLRRRADLQRNYRPILFAGLLKHWNTKGPAELPAKRSVTYQHCQWLAERHRIPMKFPPAHPFNSLPALRLAIVKNCDPASITDIFRALYAHGADFSFEPDWNNICQQLATPNGAEQINQRWVKDQLRANTDQAIQKSVFGVPTLAVGGQQFWGADMTDRALECLADPGRFRRGKYGRLAGLPVGVERKEQSLSALI